MTSDELARDYFRRARARRVSLSALMGAAAYADVVREGQEAVELSEDRSLAFYGDEERGVPASELFGEEDARRALQAVDRLLEMFERLLAEREGGAGPA